MTASQAEVDRIPPPSPLGGRVVSPPGATKLEYGEPSQTGRASLAWWEETKKALAGRLEPDDNTDYLERLRTQLSLEEQAFDAEIEEVILAGKRALLRLRMQRAAEMPGYKHHLTKKIRKQIARAEGLLRQREIARGITAEQSRRLKKRRMLQLKMQYEEAYGREPHYPKSQRWYRRMGRIV